MALGRPSDALPYYKTALEISESLAVADPNNTQAQSDVGYGHLKLGGVMSMQAQFDEATKHYRRALDLRLILASKNPENAGVKTEAYRGHFLLGESMFSDAKFDDALVQFKSAQGVLSEMLGKGWYSDPEAKIESYSIEENKQQLNDYVWLCENATKATGDLEFVMSQEPRLVPRIMQLRIQSLSKSAKIEEAFSSADRFTAWVKERPGDQGENHYQAGCFYALCVAMDNSNLEKCVGSVIDNFEKAKEAKYLDASKLNLLQQNPSLISVRSHPKFASFAMSLGN